MESCIHCGHCAEACHFYVTSEDPKYTPIWKLEPFKQAYKREAGPFAWLYRALNLKHAVTVERAAASGRSCSTTRARCAAAARSSARWASTSRAWSAQARHGMFQAGLVPHELWAVAERAEREGSPLGATPKVLKDRVEWLADEHEVEIPLDKPEADVLVTLSSIEIMKYPDSLVATARILEARRALVDDLAPTATRRPTSACSRAISTGSGT